MIKIARWKIFAVALISLFGIACSIPNFIGEESRGALQSAAPSWLPVKTVNLGLDLRGGAHLLFAVNTDSVIGERETVLINDARKLLADEGIGYERIGKTSSGITLVLSDAARLQDSVRILRSLGDNMVIEVQPDGLSVNARMSEQEIKDIADQTLERSIAVISRRVAETGAPDPVIVRKGDERILIEVAGANAEYLKRIVGTVARLGFYLVDESAAARHPLAGNNPAVISGEMLQSATAGADNNDVPYVSFRLNAQGTERLCKASSENIGKAMAIVLDGEILSAPVIREAICGNGSGQISGDFDIQGANDLALMLRAGALPAPLEILEERSIGPSMGADSIEAGKIAAIIAMALVFVFMTFSYGLFGLMASLALVINMALMLGLLSVLQATLTLPGIAGIVLTIGMAVDANVLIFERVREDLKDGRSLVSAVESGFHRAMSTITDSNLTTLIAALILYGLGTGPIQGFAVTLAIGVVTTMFSTIWLSAVMIGLWTNKHKNTKEMPV